MADSKNIGPNGKYYPPAVSEKKVEKVVEGKVKTRSKPLSRKFVETFLNDSLDSVKSYIIFDVLIPAIKDTFSEVVNKGLDMLLYGDIRGSNGRKRGGQTFVSYSGFSSPSTRPKEGSGRNRTMNDLQDLIFETRGEAEEVLTNLLDIIADYQVVSVADLYDLVGITAPFTANRYGWTELGSANVSRIREGYIINLPKPKAID